MMQKLPYRLIVFIFLSFAFSGSFSATNAEEEVKSGVWDHRSLRKDFDSSNSLEKELRLQHIRDVRKAELEEQIEKHLQQMQHQKQGENSETQRRNRKAQLLVQDLRAAQSMRPLIAGDNIMFWRPQKVGSSTLLSVLLSYGYRYHYLPRRKAGSNSFCRNIVRCALAQQEEQKLSSDLVEKLKSYGKMKKKKKKQNLVIEGAVDKLVSKESKADAEAESVPYKMSITHEVCNLHSRVVEMNLRCSFTCPETASMHGTERAARQPQVRELFMVREPVSRAVSAYYFWGELYLLARHQKFDRSGKKRNVRLGKASASLSVANVDTRDGNGRQLRKSKSSSRSSTSLLSNTNKVQYHGNESTVPPYEYAMHYAEHLPYRPGMPGPSFSWSLFADNVDDAVRLVQSDRIMSLVLERLDESLVVLRHFLGWSLADVVVAKYRKALSAHPKASQWPVEVIEAIRKELKHRGEYTMYHAVNAKLDERIRILRKEQGIDVAAEVEVLRLLRSHATQVCGNLTYLSNYQLDMKRKGLPAHTSFNKLRDVEDVYEEQGHIFSLNREIIGSFDVCGACESHALLKYFDYDLKESSGIVQLRSNSTLPKLGDMSRSKEMYSDLALSNCPMHFR